MNNLENRKKAMQSGDLHGALYYTQQEQIVTHDGIEESDETVHSKAKSKEEFPQG